MFAYSERRVRCPATSSRVLASSSTASKTTADQPLPQRVVVLDWDLLEQLLTLDIIPVGATEIASYNQWVVQPAAPEVIQEVGTRAEPNLEKIAALKPDIILASASQQDLLPILERIAPVLYLPNLPNKMMPVRWLLPISRRSPNDLANPR